MTEDPYLYPGTNVLRNKLEIRDLTALDRAERRLVAQRVKDGIPRGNFDLDHLRAIHRHLFQDIYDWAGKLRTVEISKDGHQFQFRRYIETGMGDVHRRLVKADFLKGLSPEDFARAAGNIIGDVNYVHPFREGNGRTQLQYLKQLAQQAGYGLDLTKLDRTAWLQASREGHHARFDDMARCIKGALGRTGANRGGKKPEQ
jgi:cell filamentation protein